MIPDLPLAVVIVALTKPNLWNIIFVIGILGWTGTARLVRAQTLSVKQRKFVLRAQAIGAGKVHIIRRHIFPLVLPLIVVNTVLVISLAILNESTLSSRPGRSHDVELGTDAQFLRGHERRGVVGAGRARLRHCVGRPRLHAARAGAGTGPQSAAAGAPFGCGRPDGGEDTSSSGPPKLRTQPEAGDR
ncbi:MAG: ABC transporter permease subunit [Caldilineaceae bacterium]